VTAWLWDEDVRTEGWFWLLDDDEPFYGSMRHTAPDGPRFHFVGRERLKIIPWPRTEEPEPRTLHGTTLEGTALTVNGFLPTHAAWSGSGGSDVDGVAESVVRGAHIAQDAAVEVTALVATLHRLPELLTGTQIEPGLLDPRRDSGTPSPKGDHLGVTLDDGVELLLHAGTQVSGTWQQQTSTVEATVQITVAEPQPTNQVERAYVDGMLELVGFATRRSSRVRSLAFHTPERAFTVLRKPWPQPDLRERELYSIALNLAEVDDAVELIRSWFSLRTQVGPVWSLFFTTVDDPHLLLENRFLNLMAFAEGYHRALRDRPPLTADQEKAAKAAIKDALPDRTVRKVFNDAMLHANTQPQGDRIDELVKEAVAALGFWQVDAETFRREAVQTRNWMTHWGNRTRHVADDPARLLKCTRQLELVLYVALLRDLHLPDKETKQVVGRGWRFEGLP
jgi:hypothetical protein